MRRQLHPWRFWGLFLVLPLALALASGCSRQEKTQAGPPAPQVLAAEVVQKDVPIYHEWLGMTEGLVNATVRAQVTGYLKERKYDEGSQVQKGQTLFVIDQRPFQAAVAQAKAELAQARARHATAKANLNRVIPLAQAKAVSERDKDKAVGEEQSTMAAIKAAEASLQKAELDLSFTEIKSPIEGVAGMAKAQIGDLVGTTQGAELTTVSTLDPIKVYIPLSEQEYLRASRNENENREKIPLNLFLADGSGYPFEGAFSFADRQVDPNTGTIRIAALFPNPKWLLRPGMYARVKALVATQRNALLVPQRAVNEVQGTYQVAVVGPDNTVEIRSVKVGERVDQSWVVSEGLNPGERIIVEGSQRVKNGMQVATAPFQPPSLGGTSGSQPTTGDQPGNKR